VSPPKRDRDGRKGPPILLIALLGGGVLLLGMCCIGGSIAAYFLLRDNVPGVVDDPEKELVGRWRFDGTFGSHTHFGTSPTLEFNEDGSFSSIHENNPGRPETGKWKVAGKQGASLTVEVTFAPAHPNFPRGPRPTTSPSSATMSCTGNSIPRPTAGCAISDCDL
jgi:hypothetical protein